MHLIILSLLALALVAFTLTINYVRSDNIPGPIAGRLTKFYRVWICIDGCGPLRYYRFFQQYGRVVRTGPNHVCLFKPELIPVVYDFRYKFKKSNFYDVFRLMYKGVPMDTIFTVKDPIQQRAAKRQLVTHMASVPAQFKAPITNSVCSFLGKLRELEGHSIDLWKWSCFWAFDLSYLQVFGQSFGYLDRGHDFNGMITALFDILKGASVLGQVPEYGCMLLGSEKAMKVLQKVQRLPNAVEIALGIIEERIQLHLSEPHKCGSTFICKILNGQDLGDEAKYKEVVNILFEAFFAPAMEAAVSLNCIIYCLITHPDVYGKLCHRLRVGFEGHEPQFAKVDDAYLTAVIKESLRLYTPNSMPMERVAPPGFVVDGHLIPEKTVVSIHPYMTHRDPQVYGEDAEIFRPERWLEADSSSAKLMERNFLVFGKGSRACSGRELAMLQLRTAVSGILELFDVTLTSEKSDIRLNMFWVIEFSGLEVKFTSANEIQ